MKHMEIRVPISVIIPVYNRPDFVCEALDSVYQQTFQTDEVIVVDDGSHDMTVENIRTYFPEVYLIQQAHRGVAAARNTGIRHARNDWIAFLDSDDIKNKKKIEHQWRFHIENPEWLVSQTEEIWIRKGKRIHPKTYHKKIHGWQFPQALERCLISPSAVLIHRTVFEQIGYFDESFPACEDYELWLRLTLRYPVALVPFPGVVKRGGHGDQLSHTIRALDRFRIRALMKLIRQESLTSEQRNIVLKELEKKIRVYLQGCLKRGKVRTAQKYKTFLKTCESMD